MVRAALVEGLRYGLGLPASADEEEIELATEGWTLLGAVASVQFAPAKGSK